MQSAPSNKLYAQALEILKSFNRRYASLKTRSADEIATELAEALRSIREEVGGPSLVYKELDYGSIPNSFDMNKFYEALVQDINILIDESDIVKAAVLNTHNFLKTEILKSEEENRQLHNKIKTLQLYSSSEDNSILYVGDYFYNDDNIDWVKTPQTQRVDLIKGDQISLGLKSQNRIIGSSSGVSILPGSNGIIGNNQEATQIEDLILFDQENDTSGIPTKLKNILDNQPNSVFEFEKYLVPIANRNLAKNYNFSYRLTSSDETAYLAEFADEEGEIDWANGVTDGVLVLNLLVDLGEVKTSNLVSFTPYGLKDNINGPMLIKAVRVSSDLSNWETLKPQNVWLANGIDQNTVNLDGDNIIIGQANFRIDSKLIRYVVFEIEQKHSLDSTIGHFYYTAKDAETSDGELERLKGPVPSVDHIWREKDPSFAFQNDLVQRREVFQGKRWAIGIRDVNVYQNKYQANSYLVSKKFFVPGGVDRVAIEADIDFPETYDTSIPWIKFYISPDDGKTWHQISRIQDDYFGVPEVIAYNDNTPSELRIPGVKYYEVSDTPDSLRVKIEITRNSTDDTLTPVVKSYKLKIKQRQVK